LFATLVKEQTNIMYGSAGVGVEGKQELREISLPEENSHPDHVDVYKGRWLGRIGSGP
jgi:hypothetical protein